MEYIKTPAQAELNAAHQMRVLGYDDASAAPGGADGGIDVRSSRAVAQVKWRGAQVARPELQNLYGARGPDHHRELWFFAASGYTNKALDYANLVGMLLFTYEPTGSLTPINGHASAKILEIETARAATAAAVRAEREMQIRRALQLQADEEAAHADLAQRHLIKELAKAESALQLRESEQRDRRVNAIKARSTYSPRASQASAPTDPQRRGFVPPLARARQTPPAPRRSFISSGNTPLERQAAIRRDLEQQLKANGVSVQRRHRSPSGPMLVTRVLNDDVLVNTPTNGSFRHRTALMLSLAAVCGILGWICFLNSSGRLSATIMYVVLWMAGAISLTVCSIFWVRSRRTHVKYEAVADSNP